MKALIGIGVSVGVLAGLWTGVSVELKLITWIAFVAWACFFAAGGGTTGLSKGLASNLVGVFWGWVIAQGLNHLSSSTLALSLMVTVVGLVLCLEAAVPLLSFIPGGFCGTAVYFGSGFNLHLTLISVVLGGLLGITSEFLGGRIQAAVDGASPGTVEPDPATAR